MSKFKDKLYNQTDILVALIILVIAAGVIAFRIDAIMGYPDTIAAEADKTQAQQTEQTQQQADSQTINDTTKNNNAADSKAIETGDKTKDKTDADKDKSESKNTSKQESKKVVKSNKYVTIKVPDTNSSLKVARILEKKGLIKNAKKFDRMMNKKKVDVYLHKGTFKIPKGATTKQIVKILTGKTIKL